MVSTEQRDPLEEQGGVGWSPVDGEGVSMKLQSNVFSGSWWDTVKHKCMLSSFHIAVSSGKQAVRTITTFPLVQKKNSILYIFYILSYMIFCDYFEKIN